MFGRRGYFHNTLLDDGCSFRYQLPLAPSNPGVARTVERLTENARAEMKDVTVRLFSVECAQNYYLGEWAAVAMERCGTRMFVRLRRLASQDAAVESAYAAALGERYRSRSEARHASTIERLLPGWKIVHEPECASFFESSLVVGGVMRSWGGDSYVVDYVACDSRAGRVCFESKSAVDGFTEESREKCRALRDHAITRVVALVGHGDGLLWHDFGSPVDCAEASGHDLDELRARLTGDPSPCKRIRADEKKTDGSLAKALAKAI